MTRWLIPLTIAASLVLGADLSAHGGTYRGPGDTVPPAGGGAASPTAPTAPASPASPATPASPAAPAAPATPSTPAVAPTPQITPAKTAVTGAGSAGPDLTTWEFWWEFNKEPFLNLKAKVQSSGISTGEGSLLLGLSANTSKNNTRAPTPQQIFQVVVPNLKKSLEKNDNNDIVTADMIALAKIGRDSEIPPLFEPFLGHGNQEIKETAALAYGIYQAVDALPVLKSLLLDTPAGRKLAGAQSGVDLRTRTFAAYGIGLIANAESDPAIKQDIRDTLWTVLTTDDSPLKDIRVACVISLGLVQLEDPSDLVRDLSEFMKNEQYDDLVRAHCPNAIAKLLSESNIEGPQVDALVREFMGLLTNKDTNVWLRQSLVQALGMMTDGDAAYAEDVFKTLVQVQDKGKDRQEKNYTAIAMAYIAASAAEGAPIREKITDFLLTQVQKGGTAYRPWAGLALGVMAFKVQDAGGSISAVVPQTVHERFKRTKPPSEKACYAIALGLMKNEAAKEDLRRAMEDVSEQTFRGYAAVALGLMGAREHKDYITDVVAKSRRLPDLLQQASIGLGLMSDREVVDTLLNLMQPADGSSPPLSVLAATATALGFIGDYRSVDPLVKMMENDDLTPLARAFASVALGIVADKEQLPWNSKISVDLNYRASVDTLTAPSFGNGLLDIL